MCYTNRNEQGFNNLLWMQYEIMVAEGRVCIIDFNLPSISKHDELVVFKIFIIHVFPLLN